MRKTIMALAVAAVTTSMAYGETAATEPGWYVGGSYSTLETDIVVEFDLAALVFNGGYQFNDYVAVEVRAGTGITDDDFTGIGGSVDLELDYLYGVYTKIGVPTGTNVYPYVVLGYTKAELEVSSSIGLSASDSDSDTSYGIGARFQVNDNVGVVVEYMNWYDDDDVEITGFNIGASYKF